LTARVWSLTSGTEEAGAVPGPTPVVCQSSALCSARRLKTDLVEICPNYQRPRHIANRQNRRYKGRATGNSYQQRVRELVAPPRPVVHGPAWRGGDRLGARRAGAQGARPSAVDTCDMPSSDAEKSPRIPCLYTICHAPRFRHARTRLFPGRGWSKGTRAGRRSSVAGPVTHAAHIAGP
jgi:hypothetical protein